MASPALRTMEAPRCSAPTIPILREGHREKDAATHSADRPDPPLRHDQPDRPTGRTPLAEMAANVSSVHRDLRAARPLRPPFHVGCLREVVTGNHGCDLTILLDKVNRPHAIGRICNDSIEGEQGLGTVFEDVVVIDGLQVRCLEHEAVVHLLVLRENVAELRSPGRTDLPGLGTR